MGSRLGPNLDLWLWFFDCDFQSVCPLMEADKRLRKLGKLVLNIHCKDWCWRWNSNTLASWCKELTHWKRPWCCERLRAGGEGDDRGWDGWMALLTQWTWVWVNSGNWWWTGRPGVLQSMGSQRVRHDWATELNLTWVWVLVHHHSLVLWPRKVYIYLYLLLLVCKCG